ncbi:hypothetical protein [Klebsiella aerogenes]|uniref:hypothetical protein n=1 Tax=Klebsiella aerogenes TaxID=548 RepID=UPI001C808A07|nr:hypothetical protein [Klebsiella aerogenes]
MHKKAFAGLILLALTAGNALADFESMSINCDGENYKILWGATGYAVTKNGELLTNPKFMRKTYGNDPDAALLTVEHWGRNGGMHYLKTFVFNSAPKKITLLSQYLDADNSPRAEPVTKKCTGDVNVEVFFPEG